MIYGPGSPLFRFRPRNGGLGVCVGQSKPIVYVVADLVRVGMYRVRFPDGRLSDLVNLSRVKDAALSHAAAIVNATHGGVSASRTRCIAQTDLAATPHVRRTA
jgi:hypothetical protein